ncbi:MAG: hypothetical protein ACI81L_003029 [Verrucomicrobiales bacterium]|jgi:hypothetical protein
MSTVDHRNTYLNDLLGRLDDVVDDLAELSLLGLDHEELDTVLTRTCDLVSQAQGLEFAAIQEAEGSGLSARFGNRVLTTHLAKTTHQPVRAIGSDRAMAIWLNDLPLLHGALTGGVLSRSHVAELKTIDSHRTHAFMIRDQNLLVEAAHNFEWTEWKQIVAYWLNAADPDGELTDPTDPKYGMRVRSKTNGDVAVSILMDPLTGEAFLTMHDAEVKKLERNEREQLNDDPNAPVTSQTQKNLHALLRLMVRGWRREDGSYPDFLVNIVMSEKLAEDLLARMFGHINPDGSNPLNIDPFELPIAWDDIDGRCETIRGTPIHPRHALGVLLAARLRRMVMSADNKVVNHGTDIRFFTKSQINALLVQQRGLCALGTQAPFRWLQADHIKPASKLGPTDLNNGQMINGADNQAKGDSLGWD